MNTKIISVDIRHIDVVNVVVKSSISADNDNEREILWVRVYEDFTIPTQINANTTENVPNFQTRQSAP